MSGSLPITAIFSDLKQALKSGGSAIVQAPPGAGKTTGIPVALREQAAPNQRIVMLQPRRIAARASAARIAETLGCAVGEVVGFRIRGEAQVSSQTEIEIITEGILTRMIQSDPMLTGIGTVIFDEFHERSLHSDLALALIREIRAALRPDLRLIVMSATLDAHTIAGYLDNPPILTAEGRSYPITQHLLPRPLDTRGPWLPHFTALTAQAFANSEGDVLGFLPGEREIRQAQTALEAALSNSAEILPLYGALPFNAQRRALKPGKGRRVILTTNIAETSLTLPGIRAVVDSGFTRRARFDAGSGMTRLVTERISQAEAQQRAGRAGRVAKGDSWALWSAGQTGMMAPFPPFEIETADLTGLALELAEWGDPTLALPTPPPDNALAEARTLLKQLGATDAGGRITPQGKRMARLPMHPRLAHIVVKAGPESARLAAMLNTRDPMLHPSSADLTLRYRALSSKGERELRPGTVQEIRETEARILRNAPKGTEPPIAPSVDLLANWAALGYPDRIAKRRNGNAPRFLLSGGKGAIIDTTDPLAEQPYLVITDLAGAGRDAKIRLALPISEATIRAEFAEQIEIAQFCEWSAREKRVLAKREERLGAIALNSQNWPDAPDDAVIAAMIEGIRQLGLRMDARAQAFQTRVIAARAAGANLPDMGDDALLETLEDWLAPNLSGITTAEGLKQFDLLPALKSRLDYGQMQALEAIAPEAFTTPLGHKTPIDYSQSPPEISVRLQAMLGVTTHPMIGDVPLRVTLLSPAGRPLQTTSDLPGFWASSYSDVRKDMRARYPKHHWPENPAEAEPTLRTKRKT